MAKRRFLFLFLLLFSLVLISCGEKNSTDSADSSFLDFSSDTEKAVQLIEKANGELREIKILYNENSEKVKELEAAVKGEDAEKVKEISDDLKTVITDGFAHALKAKENIAEAQELNINQDFENYLSLKERSLDKQVEAFKHRFEAAKLLRDSFGGTDKQEMERAKQTFIEKEELFKKTMEEARKISEEADDLAKESINKKN